MKYSRQIKCHLFGESVERTSGINFVESHLPYDIGFAKVILKSAPPQAKFKFPRVHHGQLIEKVRNKNITDDQ